MYRHGVLAAQVQGMGGMTPVIRMGNYLFLAMAALAVGVAWFTGRKYAGALAKKQQT